MGSVLELRGLGKKFGDATAVEDFRLEIEDGEFIVLLGPSGCGKTTTLRMIAGFEHPSSGEILLKDKVISSSRRVVPPERRNMAMMFQSYAVWPHMTVAKNLSYGLKLRKMPKRTMQTRIEESLARVKLDHLADRYPGELSGGQQQRVALARALSVDPTLLLMDEPLSNLDAKLREEMRQQLHELHAALRFSAVYVTHDQSEAMALADRIVVMDQGVIQQVGTPADLYLRPANEFVAGFIGRANMLPATVVGDGVLETGSKRIQCASVSDLPTGSDAWAVVRPIGVSIVDDGSTSDADFEGVVEDVVFLGESKEVRIRLNGFETPLLADISPYVGVQNGDSVICRLNGAVAVERVSETVEASSELVSA
ncbi:iron(III) transport system ATP-binding protein [Antricoccus suffuscus]|uniref:Iron(III) transport system ATP-binding protein n=1 Tax=Antricoccus suffuscus TaxID=1629062 RepID=A0A2T0ZB73_9ACTN|nr:ABC transporter ATP-binding protein [Antricoccus suffuscus]PRZ33551.1 iron(III) transport system ATP-binding protein [Antricoccus suffuscus]